MEKLIIGPLPHNDKRAYEAASKVSLHAEHYYVFDLQDAESDEITFEGIYEKTRFFFLNQLPEMRRILLEKIQGKSHVTLYLGAEMGTLYAAYYCALAGVKYSVHLIDPQFLGGKSPWAIQHPLLLNKLITTVLSTAFEVHIHGLEHLEMLPKAFPRIDRIYNASVLDHVGEQSQNGLSSLTKVKVMD